VTLVQRFGSMNLNVHLHVLVLDGVFTLADGAERAEFHAGERPDRANLDEVARKCEKRMKRWLRRHGYAPREDDDDACDNTADEPNALDACTDAGIARGKFVSLAANDTGVTDEDDDADFDHRRRDSRAGESGGFNVHADVVSPCWPGGRLRGSSCAGPCMRKTSRCLSRGDSASRSGSEFGAGVVEHDALPRSQPQCPHRRRAVGR